MKYVWATGTHQGRVRDHNEDAVLPAASGSGEGPLLVAVADGMGGAVAGEVASGLAIEQLASVPADVPDDPAARVMAANARILEAVRADPALLGMGTTVTLCVFSPGGDLRIAHVGDSRAYLLRDDDMEQLTTDHTVVAELIEMGHLDPSAADSHPQRHLLTRTLGLGPVAIDEYQRDLSTGDRVLVCSDGLTTMLSDGEIARIASDQDVEGTVWSLIEAANNAGGVDNTTVAVVDIVE